MNRATTYAATRNTVRRTLAVFLIMILGVGVSGCEMLHFAVRHPVLIFAPARKPSVLAVVLNSTSAGTLAMFARIAIQSARAGEQLIVIGSLGDQVLASCAAPPPPVTQVPGPPVPTPHGTSFQVASYRRALTAYRARLRNTTVRLGQRQRLELASWASRCTNAVIAASRRGDSARGHDLIAAAIEAAASSAASLEQTGVHTGTRRVILVLGFGASPASLAHLHSDLRDTTIVVAGYPVGDDGAALAARLLEAGAEDAVVLTPASDGRLIPVIEHDLGGTISVTLANLNYGPAQYRLPKAAVPTLLKVLRLMTIAYPGATAVINGYTDDIPIKGGNVKLSWERAYAVEMWLMQHGIAASRLEAVGHGASYPIASNWPHGQPRDRRVLILISPSM